MVERGGLSQMGRKGVSVEDEGEERGGICCRIPKNFSPLANKAKHTHLALRRKRIELKIYSFNRTV